MDARTPTSLHETQALPPARSGCGRGCTRALSLWYRRIRAGGRGVEEKLGLENAGMEVVKSFVCALGGVAPFHRQQRLRGQWVPTRAR